MSERVSRSLPVSAVIAPVDDCALMQRVASGDLEAFAELYDRHAPTVNALATRMLHDTSEAQDLVHDLFLEAWQCAREYDRARGSVRTWLLVRTRSRALDRFGRRRRERDAHAEWVTRDEERGASVQPSTERQLAVRQALDTLPAAVREVLELTYFEGLTALEIGVRLAIPEGTVRSRLARGLASLAPILRMLEV